MTEISPMAATTDDVVPIYAQNRRQPIDEEYVQGHTSENDPSSWAPIDLEPILSGTYSPPVPTIGRRDDGVHMFYAGRTHWISAEPESGKTWLAMIVTASEIQTGKRVIFIDFEDTANGVVSRLLALGVNPRMIRERFTYVRPDNAPSIADQAALSTVIGPDTSLIWIDGVTEAMALYGLDPNGSTDVARFKNCLPAPLAKMGPAVVLLDHVNKSTESRGRWATGSQHKLSGLNGAAYLLENVDPFGIGHRGRSRIGVAKDRPGEVTRNCLPSKGAPGGKFWFADMVIDSTEGGVLAWLYPPARPEEDSRDEPKLPTAVMEKISRFLESQGGASLSKNSIETTLDGRAAVIRTAVELLTTAGNIVTEAGPRGALMCRLVKPYRASGVDW